MKSGSFTLARGLLDGSSMRTANPVFIVVLFGATLLAGSSVSACSGPSDGTDGAPGDSHPASDPGELTADASSESREELGVESWSAKDEASGSKVEGYDASHAVVVELRRTTKAPDATHEIHTYVLRHGKSTATMEVAVESRSDGGGVLTMLANGFADRKDTARTIELIQKDFAASKSEAATPGSLTKSFAGDVHPMGGPPLTAGCTNLLPCGQSKLVRLDADAKSALVCAGTALTIGIGIAFDSATGKDPAAGAAGRAGACAAAVKNSQDKAAESAKACKIECSASAQL